MRRVGQVEGGDDLGGIDDLIVDRLELRDLRPNQLDDRLGSNCRASDVMVTNWVAPPASGVTLVISNGSTLATTVIGVFLAGSLVPRTRM